MRALTLLFGLSSYTVFLASFLYAIGWLGNLAVPKTIDSGAAGDTLRAVVIDLLLLSAFAIQHSVMARPAFKRWWTRIVPPAIERSVYVLASSLLLFAICLAWQPLPSVVFAAQGPLALALSALFWTGWLIVLASTFMINHFDLFGLRQVWQRFRDQPRTRAPFVERFLYKLVRHPIMLGFLIAFWATATMSVGHLLFAAVTTGYILVGIQFEERDLKAEHGAAYEAYRSRVRMLIPVPKTAGGASKAVGGTHTNTIPT